MAFESTRLKNFRKANGLDQKAVADLLGTSIAFISMVENGKAKLPEDKLTMLLNSKYDISTLINEEDIVEVEEYVASPHEDNEELAWYKRMFNELSRRIMEQDMTICNLKKQLDEKGRG